jgi:hypothetical protein
MNDAKLRLWQFLYDQKRVELGDIPLEYREFVVQK